MSQNPNEVSILSRGRATLARGASKVYGIICKPVTSMALAMALGLFVMFGSGTKAAYAVFTPTAVTVESLVDYAALATTILTILGLAFAAVAGVLLAVKIGKKVIRWFV